MKTRISFIIPTHNVSAYIVETLQGIENQIIDENEVELEVSIHDDGSQDNTVQLCLDFLENSSLKYVLSTSNLCRGPGAARNTSITQSTGQFLCFNDADDVSFPNRVQNQLLLWKAHSQEETLVGSRFLRTPAGSTEHYTNYLNSLESKDLYLKRFRELTLIQPTWFMSRRFFLRLGGYKENLQFAEDLDLFYRICEIPNIRLCTSEVPLVLYRHVGGSVSSKTPRRYLVAMRVQALERSVLVSWESFTIWGAGRDGKQFFSSLSPPFRARVKEFVDIDEKKMAKGVCGLKVQHFSKISSPFVVCVALGRTNGALEANIASTGCVEGVDYFHFN